ncbi:hypothetical protein AVEN_264604-1 [Araneus ventricosus]|uniref:Uncharacterized protein n=1 Tax=Araneus ventricosus TaxID=182803 RepID=A0A4Y2FUR4_ARAVE|nr:hypothetical protein AVEN_264604-1 [Araneus ventricosus]
MTRTTPELAPPSPNFHATPTGGRLTTTYDLTCNRPHTVTVTIDRLKPAHLLLDNVNSSESKLDSPGVDTPSPTPSAKEPEKSAMPLPEKSPIHTRTGRRVHFPVKYRDFVS